MVRTGIRDPPPALILAATIAAAILVVANVSSLNVALPELSRELGASQSDVQWMVDSYAVFLAALLLPAGALGDRFGRRRMLLFGIVVIIGANAATLAMDSSLPVIIARAVSGIGAAFVFPATLSTITATLPDEQRGRGVAMWTAAVSMGGILGVLLSGVLIESYWWGSVFLAMTIAAAVVLVVCWLFVPDSSDPSEANLDPVGSVLSFVAAGALVLGVIEGPVKGWTSPLSLGGLIVGTAALAAFIWWELRNPRPLLDVRLFAERGVRSGSLSIFVQFTAAFGFFFLTVPYLAFVLGFGPLQTGLGLLPVALGLFPASAAAIPLTRRFGRRVIGVIGLAILSSGFVLGTFITVQSDFLLFAAVMVVFGLGLGLSSPPATEAIVEALPPAKQGVASALNDVLREFGAAIGIAAIGSAFNSGYRLAVDDITGLPPEVLDAVRETPAAAAVIAPDLGDTAPTLLAGVSDAVVAGWGQALWLTAGIVAVGAIGYAIWAPRGASAGQTAAVDSIAPTGDHAPTMTRPAAPPQRRDLSVVEADRPLGAIELAAAAEAEVDQLTILLARLATTIDLLDARSTVPPDMDRWAAAQQVAVAERAAIAVAAPLRDLGNQCERLLAHALGCDSLIAGATSELTRLGRHDVTLDVLRADAAEAHEAGERVHGSLAGLARRFDELGSTRSTLRPAADHLRRAFEIVGRVRGVTSTWVSSPEDPPVGTPSIDLTRVQSEQLPS